MAIVPSISIFSCQMLRLLYCNFDCCVVVIILNTRVLVENARSSMGIIVNAVTVYTSYLFGKYIIDEEQQGSDRARYGARVLDSLSEYLTEEF